MDNIMRNTLTIFSLVIISSQAIASDWTPVFADLLTPISQKSLLKNQKPLKGIFKHIGNSSTDGRFGTVNLVNIKIPAYPNIPKPYRNDMQTSVVKRIDECHTTAISPLKNATLFGKPITQIVYKMDTCNKTLDDNYILFNNMNERTFKVLEKQVIFKSVPTPDDVGCTGQTSQPYAYLGKEGNEIRLSLNRNDEDC